MRLKSIFWALLLIFAFQFFGPGLFAQPQSFVNTNAKNGEKLRNIIKTENVPGISVCVILDGKTVWNEAFGFANIESNSIATSDTKFGIGSISKSLTAVLAMRLSEEGLLDIDAPIERYLPDFPHRDRGVTVRLILSHLSGYEDKFDDDNFYNAKRFETTREVLERFYNEKLAANPGERTIYGTTTFTLVAAVIEKVTGLTFTAAINKWLFEPIGLKNVVPNDRKLIIQNRTAFYIKEEEILVNGEFVDSSFKLAGAGFLSTSGDLAKFGSSIINEGLLRGETLNTLFRPAKTIKGEITPFALGFRVTKLPDGGEVILQPGGGVGISSVLYVDRKRNLSLAILSNRTFAPIGNLAMLQEFADSYFR